MFLSTNNNNGFCLGVAQADGWLVGWLAGWLAGWLVGFRALSGLVLGSFGLAGAWPPLAISFCLTGGGFGPALGWLVSGAVAEGVCYLYFCRFLWFWWRNMRCAQATVESASFGHFS